MDFWPGSSTHAVPASKKGRPRKEEKSKTVPDSRETYPIIDHGSLTAANLYRINKGLEWTILSNEQNARIVARDNAAKIFPASRPEWPPEPQVSTLHLAEQGANFLRTHYPDVDISSDLIREELEVDARLASSLKVFDPYMGNVLAPVICGTRKGRMTAFLAFPMGPTGCQLNISPLQHTQRDLTTFRPSVSPLRSFSTPIRQIVSAPPSPKDRGETTIAVRTSGHTVLLDVQPRVNLPLPVSSKELAAFTRSDFGDRLLVDLTFQNTTDAAFLAVNDVGNVFKSSPHNGGYKTVPVFTNASASSEERFWKLATLPDPNTALLLSGSYLQMLDLRVAQSALTLTATESERTTFTFVEGTCVDNMIRLASTAQVTWIDHRFISRPVFGIKHHRQWDRTLQLQTTELSHGPVTFLSSAKNGLVTVYDVSAGHDSFVHLKTPVYALPPIPIVGTQRIGQTVFRHPNNPNDASTMLLQMSDRGSIHRLDLTLEQSIQEAQHTGRTHDWSPEVLSFEKTMETALADMGMFSDRAFTEVDLEPVYKRIFGLDGILQTVDDPDTFYDTMDAMPDFWQSTDAPVEQVLTSFDVAFRSGNEPSDPSRADFFTGSAINSLRGYRAIMQGRLPQEQLVRDTPWYHSWTTTIRRFVPDVSDSVQEMDDSLRAYDLVTDDYRPGPSLRTETEAREQLTLDLALSTDVYSAHPIRAAEPDSQLDDAFETMSRATEAMSIGIPEPPPIHFGFLRPERREYYNQAEGQKMDFPIGARLLLNEWEVGADPHAYEYRDPYGNVEPPLLPSRAVKRTADKMPATEPWSQPAKLPPVIAVAPMGPPTIAASQPVRSRPIAQSQGAETFPVASQATQGPPAVSQQSQETIMPSTQVLPGPYGGRPAPVKKKPVKKRMGGF